MTEKENAELVKEEENNDDEELAFIEYQENITRSKEAKRNRMLLIFLSIAIYLIGLGLFATIVSTIYQMNETIGIIVGITLFVIYTICFIVIIVMIFSKHSFDLEFRKRKNGHFSERVNNKVRWEIADNLKEQTEVLSYIDKQIKKEYLPKKEAEKVEAFITILDLVTENKKIPSSHSEESIKLAEALSISMQKDGVIYKKAKSLIRKASISVGIRTALSQNMMMDAGIVAVKNLQLIKDIIWLYGFRPTNAEMNKLLGRIIRNVCTSIGLNQIPSSTALLGKVFNKDSNNFWIQLLGQVFNMSTQFVGNGIMTYMIGRATIRVMLNEYRIQDLFRKKDLNEYTLSLDKSTIKELNTTITTEVKAIKNGKDEKSEVKYLESEGDMIQLVEYKKKENIFSRIFKKREK